MKEVDVQELYRQLVQNCNDAIIYSDREGLIRLWNKGAEEMLGFTAGEALGQSLDIFIPENQRARHWEGYYRVMETGTTRYAKELLAAPALKKDGSRISTEFSMTIIRDAEGNVAGTVAVMRDVTARWLKEKALRARLAELDK
ncbi:PAS domain S-box protein [Geomonas subterranea]|uniref:PAS domain S-box protein n=1 Tax=Geomonas subterranea TaxID=2847989 RepID=A0ABX8LDP3_9BACT|nr:PAS domain S-box protein [Geomonas subterranea]QXE89539.1 PAS domain S-box protein [Geomonas subterranea]QXM08346.1 PAS domain S-box protein [Geomonas subterranea]